MRNKLVLLVFCLVLFVSNLRAQRVQMQQRFESAYKEIVDMLEDKEPLSIKRSVFLAEWAYLEGHLDFEQDFCEPLQRGAQYMRRLITANKWEKYKTAKQIAICTFFFQSLSGNNNTMFSYDFSNEYPDEDWHHQLVSRTLKTHKGQCRSLPWAFKLYAEELGAKAYIAHAPRHCFVMYKDEDNLFPEDWVNVEVTAQQYQPTWGIKEHFEIEDSAIIAKTYLSPLTDKETVACQLSDLALAYYHKFLRYDEFTLKCVDASLKYYPMNPNAIITKGKSLDALLQRHLEQNGCLRDDYTDEIDAKSKQCIQDLRATHWTQETEALRSKWKQSPEDIERIRKNVQIIK